MEREQIAAWRMSRPGDRIVEIDVPLSYGIYDVLQDNNNLNVVEFVWDPTKEVGVYIKVNCISTEFTPKKHGGEKGVPFRIQVETYSHGDGDGTPKRLHVAGCQIKVFKVHQTSMELSRRNQFNILNLIVVERSGSKAQTRPRKNLQTPNGRAGKVSTLLWMHNFSRSKLVKSFPKMICINASCKHRYLSNWSTRQRLCR